MSAKGILVIVSLALSLSTGWALRATGPAGRASAGGAGAGDRRHVLIGLSLDTLKEARWQADRDLFVAKAKALGADVSVQSANGDDTVQMNNVTSLLSSGINVLVIAPHNAQAMARAVELAHRDAVPVISYDRLIRGGGVDLYLSFDNVAIGRLQAQYVVDQLPKVGHRPLKLVRIYGAKTDNNAILYKQGQDEVLKPHLDNGEIVVVQEDWAEDWKPENAKRITNAAITNAGRGIDAILASNDGTAGGAVQALSEEGLAGKVMVTGQDAEAVACQRIAQGTQAMTVYKPIRRLAERAAELAVALGQGRPVVATASTNDGAADIPSVLFPSVVVTRENLDDTVVKDNFHSHAEVYGQ
jgi:D-xylose transport system substrate-binding protein